MVLDGAHLRLRLNHADAQIQSRDGYDCGRPARVEQERVALRERCVNIYSLIAEMETRRKNSNDRVIDSVQCDGLAHCLRSAGEAISPEVVADDRDRRSAALIFLRREIPAEGQLDVQRVEEAGRDSRAKEMFRAAGT